MEDDELLAAEPSPPGEGDDLPPFSFVPLELGEGVTPGDVEPIGDDEEFGEGDGEPLVLGDGEPFVLGDGEGPGVVSGVGRGLARGVGFADGDGVAKGCTDTTVGRLIAIADRPPPGRVAWTRAR